ncbi:hypothetical protein ACFZCK_17195 [Kitasatospora purpeofusca]|uniref:hypothetical protein n=1 Tax=Kitasatospora purpeofusca TaxID=67352 RepID=UPI0036F0A359
MSLQQPDDDLDSDDSFPGRDPARVWAAYGVSVAAGFHVLAAALVLFGRCR